jgi:alpha-galactosidase
MTSGVKKAFGWCFGVIKIVTGICWILASASGYAGAAESAGQIAFKGCYANWRSNEIVIGNTRFEGKWIVADHQLRPISFQVKGGESEWFEPLSNRSNRGKDRLSVDAATGRFGLLESESLRLRITIPENGKRYREIRVFPEMAGALFFCDQVSDVATNEASKLMVDISPRTNQTPSEDILLAPQHLNLTEVALVDQSDSHNELVFEREWMLAPNETEFQITNNLIFIENPLTSAGLIFLKIAPLPHARGTLLECDFKINSRLRRIQIVRNYPVVMLAYEGGRAGRIAALQSFQRQLRVPDFSRDGRFLSNTWGDRNRDTRINEAFIKREIEAGARLGIDAIQIDDGWQKGRTKGTSKNGVWSGWWAADS